MTIAIGLLTFVQILISLFLILLVLVQLPKKEAGVGMAFGAGMSEMLLGAGSGNVLTRITKYTVGIYLGLALVLSVMISHNQRARGLNFSRALEESARSGQAAPATTPAPVTPNSGLQSLVPGTNAPSTPSLISTTTVVNPTPVPAPATTTPTPPAPATPPPAPTNTPTGN